MASLTGHVHSTCPLPRSTPVALPICSLPSRAEPLPLPLGRRSPLPHRGCHAGIGTPLGLYAQGHRPGTPLAHRGAVGLLHRAPAPRVHRGSASGARVTSGGHAGTGAHRGRIQWGSSAFVGRKAWGRDGRGETGGQSGKRLVAAAAAGEQGGNGATASTAPVQQGPAELSTILRHFRTVAAPYWSSEDKNQARARLAAVFVFSLATTGVSVLFNFLGRDFYNALESKNEEAFFRQLLWYLGAFAGGIPVFVLRDYLRDTLSLRWRAWMTSDFLSRYMESRTFYRIQAQMLVDNPDQRMNEDVRVFTTTALVFSLALFGALIDLVSFSGILYAIYPPLFAVLLVYSLGGTAISVALGKDLVGLNFQQEKKEADFRYGLVRVRENAESIAFYGGEGSEIQLLLRRFRESFANYSQLLIVGRNLDFFTSFYRYLIQLLPAAVVAPLFFRGDIEFGVINQSFSAFNHILADCSIIVYQFQNLTSFSAIVERLGEFDDVLRRYKPPSAEGQEEAESTLRGKALSQALEDTIIVTDIPSAYATQGTGASTGAGAGAVGSGSPLLELQDLTLFTPTYSSCLLTNLTLQVRKGEHVLIVGPSGAGKTSLLRAIAGLWRAGKGSVVRHVLPTGATQEPQTESLSPAPNAAAAPAPASATTPAEASGASHSGSGDSAGAHTGEGGQSGGSEAIGGGVQENDAGGLIFFVPQRPYMVLGSLRQQLLYPTWSTTTRNTIPAASVGNGSAASTSESSGSGNGTGREGGEARGRFQLPGFSSELAALKGTSGPWQHNATHRPPPSDAELLEVLGRVRLGYLGDRWAGGLDAEVEWSSTLSLGEQQRIAFARLLLSRPLLALMDESTSALDEESEAALYEAVEAAGVTFVSVAHRRSLYRYHTQVLRLRPSEASDPETQDPHDLCATVTCVLEPIQEAAARR